MVAIASLLLVVVISLLVTRVAAVVLVATGMSSHAARFQARSAFTGAGFTTSEAEQVVDHPLRRRVIAALMLLGNAGIVAAASSAIIGFRGGGFGAAWWRVLELIAGLAALVFLSRSAWVDRRLNRVISHLLRRYTDLPTRDIAGLLDLSGAYAVNEFAVADGDWVAKQSLADLGLREEGVVVLGVSRQDGRYLGAPTGATVIRPGDVLIVYGRGERLCELDDRPAGAQGDLEHQVAVEVQRRHQDAELVSDQLARSSAG